MSDALNRKVGNQNSTGGAEAEKGGEKRGEPERRPKSWEFQSGYGNSRRSDPRKVPFSTPVVLTAVSSS